MANPQSIQGIEEVFTALTAASDDIELADALRSLNLLLRGKQVQVPKEQLEKVLVLLAEEDEEVVSLSCSCAEQLLVNLDYDEIAKNYMAYISIGLQVNDGRVRSIALDQAAKCLTSEDSLHHFLSTDLLPLVVQSMADESAQYAEQASEFIYRIAETPNGREALFSKSTRLAFDQISNSNDVVRVRLWNMLVRLCDKIPETLEPVKESKLLDQMMKDVQSTDPLIAMNAIDLTARLARNPDGLKYVEGTGVISSIAQWARASDGENYVDRLATCAALKFLGRLGQTHDLRQLDERFHIFEAIMSQLQSPDPTVKQVAVRVVGALGSHPDGLRVLNTSNLIQELADLLSQSFGDMRVPFLETVSCLLGVKSSTDPGLSIITESIYRRLDTACRSSNDGFLSVLIASTKQAFENLRVASYAVLNSIASHTWGRQLMAQHQNCIEHLLDRKVDPSYIGMKWKHTIVHTLSESPDSQKVISRQILNQLQRYVREGPFFTNPDAALAMESAT